MKFGRNLNVFLHFLIKVTVATVVPKNDYGFDSIYFVTF